MRASDLARQLPFVTRDTDAETAAQILADHGAVGLVIADAGGTPQAVLPGTQALRLVVPPYVLSDPRLAHVYDEGGAAELLAQLSERTVGDLLEDEDVKLRPVPNVLPEDTLMEVAALMCRERTPVVLVRGRDGAGHGVVTLADLMNAILDVARDAARR
jgi:CBS domain-containing protein